MSKSPFPTFSIFGSTSASPAPLSKGRNWAATLVLSAFACVGFTACDSALSDGTPTHDPNQAKSSEAGNQGNQNAPGSDFQMPRCVDEAIVQPNLEATPTPGISGQIFLQRAQGQHPVVLQRAESKDVRIELSPDSNGVAAQLEVVHEGGQFRHIRSKFVDCDPGSSCAAIGVICLDTLELEVKLRLRSDDGALAEEWPAILVMRDPADPDLQKPGLPKAPGDAGADVWIKSLRFAPDALKGSLKITSVQLPGNPVLKRHEVEVSARFNHGKLYEAALTHRFETRSQDGQVAGAGAVPMYHLINKAE